MRTIHPSRRISVGGIGVVLEQTVLRAARLLSEAAAPARVILFGSYARGDADEGSDLDFLVIEPQVRGRHAEAVRLRRALRGLNVCADILVASEAELAEWAAIPGSVLQRALSEGRLLFDTRGSGTSVSGEGPGGRGRPQEVGG